MKQYSAVFTPLSKRPGIRAFTLIELMLSTAVIALLMVMMLSVIGQTQQIWVRSAGKVSQFQASRNAFEAMTRNLSQATLNTYYDLQFSTGATASTSGYSRNSDLHFVSGKAAQTKFLGTDPKTYPTHAVFFQAPLGLTSETTGTGTTETKKFRTLSNLLSVVGYYVKWGTDQNVPSFIKPPLFPDRYRYRLMEVIQPAESFAVFDTQRTTAPKATDWIQTALGLKALAVSADPNAPKGKIDSSHVLAENIVALVILPKLSDKDAALPFLSPNYEYDSRPTDGSGKPKAWATLVKGTTEYSQFNQLPPVVRVTMVAIDEASAARQQAFLTTAPAWTSKLFETATREDDIAKDLGDSDVVGDDLIHRLAPEPGAGTSPKMNYRVYTMDVVIRGSKWSN